jgi:hypothetical protein
MVDGNAIIAGLAFLGVVAWFAWWAGRLYVIAWLRVIEDVRKSRATPSGKEIVLAASDWQRIQGPKERLKSAVRYLLWLALLPARYLIVACLRMFAALCMIAPFCIFVFLVGYLGDVANSFVHLPQIVVLSIFCVLLGLFGWVAEKLCGHSQGVGEVACIDVEGDDLDRRPRVALIARRRRSIRNGRPMMTGVIPVCKRTGLALGALREPPSPDSLTSAASPSSPW